jgi:hypothetical protein
MLVTAGRVSAIFGLSLGLLGCTPARSGGEPVGGGGTDAGPISAADYANDALVAYCGFGVRCGFFSSDAICKVVIGPQFTSGGFNSVAAEIALVNAGKAQFNAANAATCLNLLSTLSCGGALGGSLPTSCTDAFSGGMVADGDTCIADIECQGHSDCVPGSSATCGGSCTPISATNCETDSDCSTDQYCQDVTCVPDTAAGALGQPCGVPTACQSVLVCDEGQSPPSCVTPLEAGATCQDDGPFGSTCASGLACVPSDDKTTATCMAPASLGQPCTLLFQCGAQYVVSDIICDEAGTQKCIQMPSTGACPLAYGVNTCNPATSYCNPNGSTGVCTSQLADGASCTTLSNGVNPCGPNSSCETMATGSGQACTSGLGPVCTP